MRKSAWEDKYPSKSKEVATRKRRWFRVEKTPASIPFSWASENEILRYLTLYNGKEAVQALQEKQLMETPNATYHFEWR